MKPSVSVLHREHELVERAAACLERVADRAVAGEELDVLAVLDLLEFLAHFANGTHQRKEERALFPALLEQGVATQRIGQSLVEHVAEREALAEMQVLVEGAAYGDAYSRDRFACLAQSYARAQVEHAESEERTLLPVVEELIDDELDERLRAAFRTIDLRHGTHTAWEYADRLEALAARLGATPSAPTPAEPFAPRPN